MVADRSKSESRRGRSRGSGKQPCKGWGMELRPLCFYAPQNKVAELQSVHSEVVMPCFMVIGGEGGRLRPNSHDFVSR